MTHTCWTTETVLTGLQLDSQSPCLQMRSLRSRHCLRASADVSWLSGPLLVSRNFRWCPVAGTAVAMSP